MSKGRIIVLEGIDGCGKSTVGKILEEKLGAEVISFPTQDAKSLIASVDPPMPVMSSVLFYLQDMFEVINTKIAPLVKQGKTVVLDRFWPSTVVYQGERLCRHVKDTKQHALAMANMHSAAKRMIWLAMQEELGEDAGCVHIFTLVIPFREALLRALKRNNEPDQFERDVDKVWDFRASFYEKVSFDDDNETKISVLGKTPEQIADEILEDMR